jgi:peptidoglycan/xylan/chitin deacetylase (PgdA/CDA1 family)
LIKRILILSGLFFLSLFAQQREIAVTIDDLPLVASAVKDSSEYIRITEKLVNSLRNSGIRAVGFVNEEKLFQDGELMPYRLKALDLWLERGQDLGNHSYSHYSLHKVSYNVYTEDILKGQVFTSQLLELRGRKIVYFRHPYLHTGRTIELRDSVTDFLEEHGYKVAPVTIDNSEWIFAKAYEESYRKNDSTTMEYVISEYIPYMLEKVSYFENQSLALLGYNIKHILLLHANRLNADSGDKLFHALKEKGYKFISLDEALTDPAYSSKDNFTGAAGISWLHRWAISEGKMLDFFAGENKVPRKILKLSGVENE